MKTPKAQEVIENGTVLVQGNKIVAVGANVGARQCADH
jgi:imidazolonepropionase-like amidohydrolase